MKMTRRGFVGTIGLGSAAGLLSSAGLTSRHANAASYADEVVSVSYTHLTLPTILRV